MACNPVPNPDGSWDCTLDISDGTQVAYKTFLVNGVHPEGLGCDPLTGQLYAFDAFLQRVALGLVVNLQTGGIVRSTLAPPKNLRVVKKQ